MSRQLITTILCLFELIYLIKFSSQKESTEENKWFYCARIDNFTLHTIYHLISYYKSYNTTTPKEGMNVSYHLNLYQNVIENDGGKPSPKEYTFYQKNTTKDGAEDYAIYGGNRSTEKDNMERIEVEGFNLLKIHFPKGEKCKEDSSKNYTATAKLHCEEFNRNYSDGSYIYFNESDIDKRECNIEVDLYTYKACSIKDFYIGTKLFYNGYYIFGPIMILIGIFYIALGAKYILPTSMISNGVALSYLLYSIIFNIFGNIKYITIIKINNVWIVLSVGVVVGLALGFVFWKFAPFMNVLILNAGIGYCTFIFLFYLFMKYFTQNLDYIFWISMVIFAIGAGLISFYFTTYKMFYIISTAIIGGYFFVRGIALMIGESSGFFSENKVFNLEYDLEKRNEYYKGYVYIFLVVWAGLSTGSVFLQRKMNDVKGDGDYAKIDY